MSQPDDRDRPDSAPTGEQPGAPANYPSYPQDEPSSAPPPYPGQTPGYPGSTPAYPNSGYSEPPPAPSNTLAIISLVAGIIGLLFLGIILGPVAIVCGILALGKVKRGESTAKGMAIAGIVLGSVSILLFVVLLASLAAG